MNKYTFNLTTLIFPPPNHISNFFCKSVQRAQSLKTLFRSHHSHRNVLDCALPHQVGKMETEGAPCTLQGSSANPRRQTNIFKSMFENEF